MSGTEPDCSDPGITVSASQQDPPDAGLVLQQLPEYCRLWFRSGETEHLLCVLEQVH